VTVQLYSEIKNQSNEIISLRLFEKQWINILHFFKHYYFPPNDLHIFPFPKKKSEQCFSCL